LERPGQVSWVAVALKATWFLLAVGILGGCGGGNGTGGHAGHGGSIGSGGAAGAAGASDGGGSGTAGLGGSGGVASGDGGIAGSGGAAAGGSPGDASGGGSGNGDGAAGRDAQGVDGGSSGSGGGSTDAGGQGGASATGGVSGSAGTAGAGGAAGVCPSACTIGSTRCGPFSQVMSCQAQGNGCPSWSATTTCADDQACHRLPVPMCFDPRWAQWVEPNSAVDVAKGAPHPTHYTDVGDGTVVDDVTHLMWQKTIDGTNMSPPPEYGLPTALGYCIALRLAGYDDWRLPSAIELGSIVDYGHSGPSIDTTVFPNTPAGTFWTSTAVVNPVGWAWIVIFDDARTTRARSSDETYSWVRCVR
jgi:Protein of unknown function (DUF1566)